MNNKNTWLLFSINATKYALSSISTKEITSDSKVFPLPFVPNSIAGLINRHGEPYTIIDPAVLLGEQPQETSLFLVLNGEEQNCLRITEVFEFANQENTQMATLENEKNSSLFLGSILIEKEEIPVINVKAFIAKATIELENS